MTTDGRWCGRRSPVRRSGGGSVFLKVPLLGPNPATSAADACECPPSQGWAISSTACLGPIIIPRALLFGSLPLLAAVGGVRRAAALIVRWLAAGLGLASEPSHLPPIGPVPLKCQLDDRFHETTQLHLGLFIHGMRPFRASRMIRTLETLD